MSFFNFCYGMDKNKIKKIKQSEKSKKICNQKYIPLDIEQSLNSHTFTVKFTAQSKIDSFIIKNVRGLDGVTISKFQEQNQPDFQRGESLSSAVELSDFSGQVFVVFDISLTTNGKTTEHSIPLQLGVLSSSQKKERAKNIKEFKVKDKEGVNAIVAPLKKYHEMQAE